MPATQQSFWGLGVVALVFGVVSTVLITSYLNFKNERPNMIPDRSVFFLRSRNLEQLDTQDPSETQDWNAYTSPGYGFTFKYPKDWRVGESQTIMGIDANQIIPAQQTTCDSTSGCVDVVNFGIVENPEKMSPRVLMEKKFGWTVEFVRDFRPVMVKNKKCYAFDMVSAIDAHSDHALWMPIDSTHFFSLSGSYLNEDQNKIFKLISATLSYGQ